MGGWRVEFSPNAEDDLSKLDLGVRRRIIDKLEWFSENFEHLSLERLTGEQGDFYKLRVGDWRVFYSIQYQNKLIRIEYIGPRDKAYKR